MDMSDIPSIDPQALLQDLTTDGYATRPLLPGDTCSTLAGLYDEAELFRKRIIMEHQACGRGEYQ